MSTIAKKIKNLDLRGGILCLDFVNTVDWWEAPESSDYLSTFQDVVTWGQHVGIVTDEESEQLRTAAAAFPVEAERVFTQTIGLRETLYRIFCAISHQAVVAEEALWTFNGQLSKVMAHSRIIQTASGFALDSTGNKKRLDWMLGLLIQSAMDLLLSNDLKRLKQCSNPKCGWLFLDQSRNKSRNWCDMKVCGNRAKAHRFYTRKRTQAKKPGTKS